MVPRVSKVCFYIRMSSSFFDVWRNEFDFWGWYVRWYQKHSTLSGTRMSQWTQTIWVRWYQRRNTLEYEKKCPKIPTRSNSSGTERYTTRGSFSPQWRCMEQSRHKALPYLRAQYPSLFFESISMNISKNSRIAILWFGREGLSTYSYVKKRGFHDITILDKRKFDDFSDEEKSVLQKEKYQLGETYWENVGEFDVIIKTPWISPYDDKIAPYRHKITSQAQIFADTFDGKIIAVTGTKGKSTTTSLIYKLLKDAGFHVGIIGNIWNPVLDALEANYDFVVFEISSYMLDWLHFNPFISVLINIYPEHLDYHRTFENYKNAKLSIVGKNSLLVYHKSLDSEVQKFPNTKISFWKGWMSYTDNMAFYYDKASLFSKKGVRLIGKHNEENISAAVAIWVFFGIPTETIEKSLKNFEWLNHRLQYISKKHDIIFYDDAISTTPQSTIAAIDALEKVNTIFLGGTDRGYDFGELAENILASNIENIVFFPESGERIARAITERNQDKKILNILFTHSMQEAVDFAFQKTKPEKICLLSCASPSYSLWKNFEAKGDEFQKYIKEYI